MHTNKSYCVIYCKPTLYSIINSIETKKPPESIYAGDILGVEGYLIHFKRWNGDITYFTPNFIQYTSDVFVNKYGELTYTNCIHVNLEKLKESEKNINQRKR